MNNYNITDNGNVNEIFTADGYKNIGGAYIPTLEPWLHQQILWFTGGQNDNTSTTIHIAKGTGPYEAANLWHAAVHQQADYSEWKKNPAAFGATLDPHMQNLAVALSVGFQDVANGKLNLSPEILEAYVVCYEGIGSKRDVVFKTVVSKNEPLASYATLYFIQSQKYGDIQSWLDSLAKHGVDATTVPPNWKGMPVWGTWSTQYPAGGQDNLQWDATNQRVIFPTPSTFPVTPSNTPPPATSPFGVLTPAGDAPEGADYTPYLIGGGILAVAAFIVYKQRGGVTPQ